MPSWDQSLIEGDPWLARIRRPCRLYNNKVCSKHAMKDAWWVWQCETCRKLRSFTGPAGRIGVSQECGIQCGKDFVRIGSWEWRVVLCNHVPIWNTRDVQLADHDGFNALHEQIWLEVVYPVCSGPLYELERRRAFFGFKWRQRHCQQWSESC